MASKTAATTATKGGGGASVVDVLDRVIGLPGKSAEGEEEPPFVASDKWRGPRPGYVFRTSEERGTGYHLDDDDDDDDAGAAVGNDGGESERKRARFDSSRDTTLSIPARPQKRQNQRQQPTGDELLAEAEAAISEQPGGASRIIDLNPRGINLAAQALEKTMGRNQLQRAQHGDDPERFMASELTLNDEVVGFQSVAVNLALYETFVDCGVMGSFLTLMNHENSDVAISVINVLVELLDPVLLREGGKEVEVDPPERARNMGLLANAFVDGGGLELLSSNMARFDESMEEDAKGVEDSLTLVESLLDLDRTGVLQSAREKEESKSVVSCVCEQSSFLSWLFQRIEESDDSEEAATAAAPISPAVLKLHASEVMSAILQHEDYAMKMCGRKLTTLPKYASAFDDDDEKPAAEPDHKKNTIDGMEVLLLTIAAYRKSDPQVEVECELLENVFDALAASLMREDNVMDFVEAEGIELMLRCIRQKVHAGGGALKVLNFALSGSSGANINACQTFVHAGGLKILFPLYMARKSAIPCPAACSEGGSNLAKKGNNNGGGNNVSKRAKRAAHARKMWLVEVEQNAINVMYALTRHVTEDSRYDAHARLMAKFVEEDCEKCDRSIELCLKYDEKARVAEYQYFRGDEAEEAEKLGVDIELAALDAKLRGGGDLFHRSCAVLSFACVGSKRCRGHVMDQLKLQGSGIGVVKLGLKEFASLLSAGSQKSQIEHCIIEI